MRDRQPGRTYRRDMPTDLRPKPVQIGKPLLTAAVVDAAAILAFAAIGRRSHDETVGLLDVALVAWPFLVGALGGWIVTRAWRGPLSLRVGFVVWAAAWSIGMTLRWLTGGGVAPSFLVVAGIALAALVLGWRVVVVVARRFIAAR